MNRASRWRLAFAEEAAAAYALDTKVAATLVGGSTARGHADRWSDIEIGAFWSEPPALSEREAAAGRVDGKLFRLYAYDENEEVWSDDFHLGHRPDGDDTSGVLLEVSNMTSESMERLLDAVLVQFDTDPGKQNVLSAIVDGIPVHGKELLRQWSTRASAYPDELAENVVRAHGQIDHFWRSQMWLERSNNLLMLNDSFVQAQHRILHTLLGLNRTYYFGFKWLDLVADRLTHKPENLAARMRATFNASPHDAVQTMSQLVEDTYDLIERSDLDVDVDRLRSIFRYERVEWGDDPPQP